jgi:hypothetical protein
MNPPYQEKYNETIEKKMPSDDSYKLNWFNLPHENKDDDDGENIYQ